MPCGLALVALLATIAVITSKLLSLCIYTVCCILSIRPLICCHRLFNCQFQMFEAFIILLLLVMTTMSDS